ncbi:MAG: nucleoside transporter [Candidatus Ancillula sp.]|nr:nucleoside transporter [Candidatus Ancillula sp.]
MLPYLLVNILGIAVFVGIGILFSRDRKAIDFRGVVVCLCLNFILAAFFLLSPIGRLVVKGIADAFAWIVSQSYSGIGFVLGDLVPKTMGGSNINSDHPMMFITTALLPMLLIIPLFDILTYFRVLPCIINVLGKGIAFLTKKPKFESFFSLQMMLMGSTEAIYVSRFQLSKMSPVRNLTISMMAMSSVTAAIIGSYIQLVPAEFVISAIPINAINAILVANLLNPVKVSEDEDKITTSISQEKQEKEKRPLFMTFLGESILGAGKMVLIVAAMVITYVALANFVDALLQLTQIPYLKLENILGVVLFPFAWLLGFDPAQAFELASYMGTKLVMNEFVVMGQVSGEIASFSRHFTGVLTVFLTSFANLSTLGMILGSFGSFSSKKINNILSKQTPRILLSGLLVSLLSAAITGVFIW